MSVVCLHAWFRFCSSILSLFWFSHNWVNKLKYSILRYSVMLARVLSARHKHVFHSAGLWMASLRTFSDSLFSRFITIFTQNSLRAEAQLCFVLLRVLAWRVIRSLCQSEVTAAVLIAKAFYPTNNWGTLSWNKTFLLMRGANLASIKTWRARNFFLTSIPFF